MEGMNEFTLLAIRAHVLQAYADPVNAELRMTPVMDEVSTQERILFVNSTDAAAGSKVSKSVGDKATYNLLTMVVPSRMLSPF